MVRVSGKHYKYLYGPVPSRRLGRSLGIDLVPHKICTYDCIYCQVGRTTKRSLVRQEYVPVKEVLEEVELFLKRKSPPIDHFSLTGSGEPTLHSQIGSIIREIKSISAIPVAVITNGSLLYQRKVRKDLLPADVVLPSLDAVTPEIFTRINRPHPKLSAQRVIEGMIEFRRVYKGQMWLEILFCKGVNDGPGELREMKDAVERIQPDRIHLNTVVRPPSEDWAKPLDPKELKRIKAFLGDRTSIIAEFDRHLEPVPRKELKERILKMLERRPLSSADLMLLTGSLPDVLDRSIGSLMREGRIRRRSVDASVYYEIAGFVSSPKGRSGNGCKKSP